MRSLREHNVFSSVSLSLHRGGAYTTTQLHYGIGQIWHPHHSGLLKLVHLWHSHHLGNLLPHYMGTYQHIDLFILFHLGPSSPTTWKCVVSLQLKGFLVHTWFRTNRLVTSNAFEAYKSNLPVVKKTHKINATQILDPLHQNWFVPLENKKLIN